MLQTAVAPRIDEDHVKSESEIQTILAGHQSRNTELLRVLEGKSIPLFDERLIEHHFWSPNRQSAAHLGQQLYASGFLVTALAPATRNGEQRWNVEAAVRQRPSDAASEQLAEQLTRMAAQYDALYDGWGTHV